MRNGLRKRKVAHRSQRSLRESCARVGRHGSVAVLFTALFLVAVCGATSSECLALSGSRVLAGDLAKSDVRFLTLPPETEFGYLPDPGERRTLVLPSGEALCIERSSRVLSEDEIRAALALPKDVSFEDATLEEMGVEATIQDYSRTPVPDGILDFPLSGIAPPARGADSVLWRGVLRYEPGRTIAVWARVRLQRRAPCLRAGTDIATGEAPSASSTEVQSCDAAAILAPALASLGGIHGKVASQRLRKGDWLTLGAFGSPYSIVARRQVTLSVHSGAARLSLQAIAEEAGREGDTIWVRTLGTRERVQGQITGPNQVALVLTSPNPSQSSAGRAARSDSSVTGHSAQSGSQRHATHVPPEILTRSLP